MDEFLIRAKLAKLEVDRLATEAQRVVVTDPERCEAIKAEMDVIIASLYDIHREQLIAQLPAPPGPRRRWWPIRLRRKEPS